MTWRLDHGSCHLNVLDVRGGELLDSQLFCDLDIHGLSKPFPITGVCWDMDLARASQRLKVFG